MKLLYTLPLWALTACAPAENHTPLETSLEALTAEQCMYFEEGGHVTICHATGNPNKPYRQIRIATPACVNAHADHPGDSIAVNGDCGPDACLAEDTPCDNTRPCCDELTCTEGRCAPRPLVCVTEDFTSFGCDTTIDQGSAIFGGGGTMSLAIGASPLAVYQTQLEACEFSFGPCSTLNIDSAGMPMLTAQDNIYAIAFDFPQLQESFAVGKIYGLGVLTFTFYRDGVAVLTDAVSRNPETDPSIACEVGNTESWAPAGGFDRVVVQGGIFGLTDLETCHR